MPEPDEYLSAEQRDGKPLGADLVYKETWEWLDARSCTEFVSKRLIEQYAQAFARYVQCEQAISKFALLGKHPTTGSAIASPFVAMSQSFGKQANMYWYEIFDIVRATCTTDYSGTTPAGEPAPKIFNSNSDAKNGQFKCPKCGATDIDISKKTGKLRCTFCRYEFEPDMLPTKADIFSLTGATFGIGTHDIAEDASDVVTLKCESCGAEVVINMTQAMQVRCHWCRNTLSLNQQIPNGAVPDAILPFGVSKEEAKQQIEEFVKKRKFFAHPTFTKEFTTENISQVYFPYFVADINASDHLSGTGGIRIKKYTLDDETHDSETVYDVDTYHVERSFISPSMG